MRILGFLFFALDHLSGNPSFPLLINLNGKATYLISLKDYAGLVKMYAFVDVVDYQKVVVTEASYGIEQAAKNYLGVDGTGDVEITYDTVNFTALITSIKEVTINGTTYYYLTDDNNNHYRVSIIVDEMNLPFLEVENTVSGKYYKNDTINEITEVESINKAQDLN